MRERRKGAGQIGASSARPRLGYVFLIDGVVYGTEIGTNFTMICRSVSLFSFILLTLNHHAVAVGRYERQLTLVMCILNFVLYLTGFYV